MLYLGGFTGCQNLLISAISSYVLLKIRSNGNRPFTLRENGERNKENRFILQSLFLFLSFFFTEKELFFFSDRS